MLHQQKLIHIQDFTSIAAANAVVIATGLLIDADNNPSLPVAPQRITVEAYGADPGATSRWWTTAKTTAGFTLNWAGYNAGVLNLHVVASLRHSICFDISSESAMY